MTKILMSIEPRMEEKKTILANELDEFNEITFIQTGQLVIGYEVNNQKRYCLKFTESVVIGAYECMFNKRSAYIYTTLTECEGLFIRKNVWDELADQFDILILLLLRSVDRCFV